VTACRGVTFGTVVNWLSWSHGRRNVWTVVYFPLEHLFILVLYLRNAFLTPCSLDVTSLTSRHHTSSPFWCPPPSHVIHQLAATDPSRITHQLSPIPPKITLQATPKPHIRDFTCWSLQGADEVLRDCFVVVCTCVWRKEWRICYCVDNTCFPDPFFAASPTSFAVSFVTYASALFQMQ